MAAVFLSVASLAVLILTVFSGFARAQDGTGKQYGVFDAWEESQPGASDGDRVYDLGKVLTVKVANLDGWLMEEIDSKRLESGITLSSAVIDNIHANLANPGQGDLTTESQAALTKLTWGILGKLDPVIDGIILPKSLRLGYEKVPGTGKDTIFLVRFRINRDSSDSPEWKTFLKTSENAVQPTFTLSYVDQTGGSPRNLISHVGTTEATSKKMTIHLYSETRLVVCGLVLLAVIVTLIMLCPKSEILRDVTQPLKPDGRYPWSLSRAQMAFWFILVVGSFMFLWVVTDTIKALNTTALVLIGIGSATALGAAAIAPKGADEERVKLAAMQYATRTGKNWRTLRKEAEQNLSDLKARGASEVSIQAADAECRYFRQNWIRGLIRDWLAEEGVVSFHRFQMLSWTFVLGVIFISYVATQLEMPDFDAAILGLTGISAGTYIGAKLLPATSDPKP